MQRKRGFTLIELLVVIAIIAILAAILFPVFAQARERARAITCVSNLKQIALATLMYTQDYDETFPSGWTPPSGMTMWRITVLPYIQQYGTPGANPYDSSKYGNRGILWCLDTPSGSPASYGPTSYGYNGYVMTTGWASNSDPSQDMIGRTQAYFIQPASLVMYADAAQVSSSSPDPYLDDGACSVTDSGPYKFNPLLWTEGWSDDWEFGLPGPVGSVFAGAGDWGVNCSGHQGRRPVPRHDGFINAAFVDGHVKAERAETLKVVQGSAQDIWTNHN